MRITENKLRRIIRQVILESMQDNDYKYLDSKGSYVNPYSRGRSPGLDGWLRESALEKCQEILGKDCKYVPGDEVATIMCGGNEVMRLQRNSIHIEESCFSPMQLDELLSWMRSGNAIMSKRTYGCSGVFVSSKGGLTSQVIRPE